MNKKIVEYLLNKGAKPNWCGFQYAHDAIDIYLKAKKPIRIIRDVYTVIATRYEVTTSKVERGIRHMIETLDKKQRATNGEFLARAALDIKIS